MCGIAGFVGSRLEPGATEAVGAMLASMSRRGPDAEGLHEWPAAVLGHRRLSIFDLSDAGRQPMVSPDGQTGVVFNGAIYNFRTLRRELEQCGYAFRSQTDTEVLLHGYREWGMDALVARLRGMFAFALWDHRKRALTLVRDRLGVKPLLYARRNGGGLAFASTVSALCEAGMAGSVDLAAVHDVLEFGWVPDDRCIYTGIRKLPAATILEWENGRIAERSYWKLPRAEAGSRISFEDAVEQTEEAILEAVRLRLDADVPVGALLSGGIDSALVCWAMAKLNANIHAFTVGTPGDIDDETADARRTAQKLGIPHEIVPLPPGEPPALPDLASAYSEPFAVASGLGMLQVSRAIKPRVTVLLTGDGGDDVFLGYPRHLHMFLAQRAANALPRALAAQWTSVRPLAARFPALRRPMHFLDYATGGLGCAAASDTMAFFDRNGLLKPPLAGASRRSLPCSVEAGRRVLTDFLDYEQRMQFVAEYMTKVDGATMFHALEARSPFLDQHIWELAASLPYSVRLRHGRLKAVLREITRRRIGAEVAFRKKRGFSVPVQRWLANGWKPELEKLLDPHGLAAEGWVDTEAVRGCVLRASERGSVPEQLWRLLVLEEWLRQSREKTVRTPELRTVSR